MSITGWRKRQVALDKKAENTRELGLDYDIHSCSPFCTQPLCVAVREAVKAEREACALIAETPISGEQDDITMEAKDRVAEAIRARGQA